MRIHVSMDSLEVLSARLGRSIENDLAAGRAYLIDGPDTYVADLPPAVKEEP